MSASLKTRNCGINTSAVNTSYFLSSPEALSFPVSLLSKTCLALVFHRLPEDLNFHEKVDLSGSKE